MRRIINNTASPVFMMWNVLYAGAGFCQYPDGSEPRFSKMIACGATCSGYSCSRPVEYRVSPNAINAAVSIKPGDLNSVRIEYVERGFFDGGASQRSFGLGFATGGEVGFPSISVNIRTAPTPA